MCASTRFPEAIPLRKMNSQNIAKALTKFCYCVWIAIFCPVRSGLFQQVKKELGITQHVSNAYHPQLQGALERHHQTMKTMLRCFWDEGIPCVMFASRSVVQESLGFSPFEFVFGHNVLGPMKVMSEQWLSEVSHYNLLDYVVTFHERLHSTWNMAEAHLKKSQSKMPNIGMIERLKSIRSNLVIKCWFYFQ